MGRAKTAPGSPACFLSGIFRAGSLYPLARGCRRIWRGEVWFRPARCTEYKNLAGRADGRSLRRPHARNIVPALELKVPLPINAASPQDFAALIGRGTF